MSYLEHEISVIPRATEHVPHDVLTIAQALEEIRTGRYASKVEQVRAENDKEQRRRIKVGCPAYTFCGRFTYVSTEGLLIPSGVICMDLDDLADLARTRRMLEAHPNSLAVFASTSGAMSRGLKVLVPVDPVPQNNDENHVAYMTCARLYGIEPDLESGIDTITKDITRLCFTSYDPDIYINPDALPVFIDYSKIQLVKRTRESLDRLPDGKKYEILRDVGGLLRYAGLSAEMIATALQALREQHGESPGDAEPVEKLARWLGEREVDDGVNLSNFRAAVIKASYEAEEMRALMQPKEEVVQQLQQLQQRKGESAKKAPKGHIGTNGVASKNEGIATNDVPVNPPTSDSALSSVKIIGAREFLEVKFPPIAWIVPNIIPEGLTMLAGKPKTGKSFLAVNIAVAVASGGYALGKVKCEQGRVLYINADSSQREFQKRLRAFDTLPDMLDLAFGWPRLDEGGLDAIYEYVEQEGDVRLIVVDTLKKIRPPDNHKKRLYDQDYEALDGLAQIVRERCGIGIIPIHHANKLRDADDPFDMISGSTGLTAALDTGLVLREMPEGTALFVKGKEVPQTDLAITQDDQIGTWVLEGDVDTFNMNSVWQQVLDAINAGVSTPQEVTDLTGINYNTVRSTMTRMAVAGKLRKSGRGQYAIRERGVASWLDQAEERNESKQPF